MQEPQTLRRWQLSSFGREQLRQVELPLPTPGPGQILVRVGAVSLNYRDLLMVRDGMGMKFDMPFTPGSDMAGTIVATGPGVQRFAIGDRVVNTFWGGWIDGQWPTGAVLAGGPGPGMLASHVVLDRPGPWRRRPRWTSPKRARCRAQASPPGSRWPRPARTRR